MDLSLSKLRTYFLILGLICEVTFANRKTPTKNHARKSSKSDKNTAERPHIIFIMADDLGFNDVGWHALGGSRIRTPYLDHLAYNGVRLENYYVQPMCSPTRTSLMTGRYVANMGLPHVNFSPADGLCLPFDQKILPEKLRDLGYATHAVGKWHLGFSRKSCLPTNRGFDSFFGILTGTANHWTHRRRPKGNTRFHGNAFYVNATATTEYDGQFCSHLYTKRAVDIIKTHDKTKPLFLYAAFEMVHNPATVPLSYENRFLSIANTMRRILAGQIFLLNEAVRNITVALKRRGLYQNSVIIFTSDNGGRRFQRSSNYPLRGEKGSLWEGGIRSAAFVHSPLLPPFVRGMANSKLMHVTDWLPTLVEGVAGGNLSDLPIALDGYNVWSSIEKNRRSPRKLLLHNINPIFPLQRWTAIDHFYWGKYNDLPFDPRRQAAIRFGDWKLLTGRQGKPLIELPEESDDVLPADTDGWKRTVRLYRIDSDPSERYNVAAAYPEKVLKMMRKLRQFQKQSQKPIKSKRLDINFNNLFNDSWGPFLDDDIIDVMSAANSVAGGEDM